MTFMMVGTVMLWKSVTWRDNRSIGARRPDDSVPGEEFGWEAGPVEAHGL
jgi:hypothetical protein